MITIVPDFVGDGLAWAQDKVRRHHYLHKPVDVRSRPFCYTIESAHTLMPIGCLIFGRPEATRCYDGNLTYGSQSDVERGRAAFDRWAVLNLARVWVRPAAQPGGGLYYPGGLPGYTDRRGVWRSTLASTAIREALARVGFDYLAAHPPVDCAYPYQIEAVLSYCDTGLHKGTIYQASGFTLARRNERGIETWFTMDVCPLAREEDCTVRALTEQSARSRRIRSEREAREAQGVLPL